jgi:hypothetical protein
VFSNPDLNMKKNLFLKQLRVTSQNVLWKHQFTPKIKLVCIFGGLASTKITPVMGL